jgi:FKBP-type peptidyl-prolyl cis-trans isomerase FklB
MKQFILSICVVVFSTAVVFSQTKKLAAKPAVVAKAKTAATQSIKPKTGVLAMTNEADSVAYSIGMNVGRNLKNQNLDKLNTELIYKGLQDVMKAAKCQLDDPQANAVLGKYFEKLQREKQAEEAIKQAEEAKQYEPMKLAGAKFLEENKKKDSVVVLPSGLQYKIMKAGTGPKPTLSNTVKTHYHGTLMDGTIFDSSVRNGTPAEFPVGGVIQGWVEALQLMPVGSKWKLFVPYNLAYGERSAGPAIKPYSTLIFEVELLEITK